MKLILLGDIHSKWGPVQRIAEHERSEDSAILCVGDLCNYQFDVLQGQRFVFVWGNHDSERFLREQTTKQKAGDSVYALTPGDVYTLADGTRVAGLSGVYSDHFFGEADRPLKYYGAEDVEKMKAIQGVDILLTHEAPAGIGLEKEGRDIGRQEIADIIVAMQPRLAVFGHHHIYHEGQIGATRVIGLEQPKNSYVLLDTADFSTQQVSAALSTGKTPQWTYEWER